MTTPLIYPYTDRRDRLSRRDDDYTRRAGHLSTYVQQELPTCFASHLTEPRRPLVILAQNHFGYLFRHHTVRLLTRVQLVEPESKSRKEQKRRWVIETHQR